MDIAVSFILIKIGRPFPKMAIIPGLKRSLDHGLRKSSYGEDTIKEMYGNRRERERERERERGGGVFANLF